MRLRGRLESVLIRSCVDCLHLTINVAVVTNCPERRRELDTWLQDPSVVLVWHRSLDQLRVARRPAVVVLERAMLRNAERELLRLRHCWPTVEIAVVGASGERDIAALLDAGADDAMLATSPACVSRLRALARRSRTQARIAELVVGGLRLDRERQRAYCDGQPLALTQTEWAILACLVARQPQTVTVETINATVWDGALDDQRRRLIRVFVSSLRDKLAASTQIEIVTRRGEGYAIGERHA
jgi:DNA-binding response OmpR family regulator